MRETRFFPASIVMKMNTKLKNKSHRYDIGLDMDKNAMKMKIYQFDDAYMY